MDRVIILSFVVAFVGVSAWAWQLSKGMRRSADGEPLCHKEKRTLHRGRFAEYLLVVGKWEKGFDDPSTPRLPRSSPTAYSALVPPFLPLCSEICNLAAFSEPPNKVRHLPLAGHGFTATIAFAFEEALFQPPTQRFLLADCSIESLIQRRWTEISQCFILLRLFGFPLAFERSHGQ